MRSFAKRAFQLTAPTAPLVTLRPAPEGAAPHYVVPEGRSLVVTGVDLAGAGFDGVVCYLGPLPGAAAGQELLALSAIGAQRFHYPAGIVFPSGSSVSMYYPVALARGLNVTLHGYLTAR